MKISRDRLVQIIKEELEDMGQSQWQNDPEEGLMNQRAAERIQEIDAEIARLQAEKEGLMVNIDSSMVTQKQIMTRGPNE